MTDVAVTIDTAELRLAFNTFLDHMEAEHGSALALPVDPFWSVPQDNIYEVETLPEVTLGSVVESWRFLQRLRNGDAESAVAFEAVWFSDVLEVIGHSFVY